MKSVLIGGAAAVALIAGGCSADVEPDGFSAEVMCQEFVKKRLKSPSSAKFDTSAGKDAGKNTWKVTGAVDSENSFGASLNSEFTCTVKHLGDDEWQLEELTGLDG